MSTGDNLFFYQRTRNFVTERLITPKRELEIRQLERRFFNNKLKPFEALNVDKYIFVTDTAPCLTTEQRLQAVNDYYNYLYGKPNAKKIRL